MAKSATTTKKGAKARKKAAPQPVDEVDDDELDETEDDEETAEAKPFGVRDICELIKQKTGDDVHPRELRTLIRKMAREENPRVVRDVVPGNKQPYEWSGPNDPEVKAIVKAYRDGELAADRAEKLAALKERKAAQKADAQKAGKTTTKAGKKGKKKAAPPPVVEDDDDEELEDDDDD